MKALVDKIYWKLMPPFLIVAVAMAFYLPPESKPYSVAPVLVFWVVYYGVKARKRRMEKNNQSKQ